jgi:glyoxylase-like metal-dependent hydrolase (beta-lactamase superfamily II)
MFVETFPVGPLQCNCTVLACERTREAVIIDPGDEPERILDVVRANDLTVTALLHTHAHIDHVGATGPMKAAFDGVPVIGLHRGDLWLYDNVPMQAQMLGLKGVAAPPPPDRWLDHGDVITWGDTGRAEVLHTPGHTPGSICFQVDDAQRVFTGDTLFRGSIGRTDLWGGSYEGIIRSIQEQLKPLDPDLVVVAGHGPSSTIGEEQRSNPFLNQG